MTTVLARTVLRKADSALHPMAWRPVLLIASAVAAVLVLVSPRYGYFADELYFIAAGHHPSWGYADQPPLIPLLASTLDRLAPGSLVVLRSPAALAMAAGVVVTALIARELGGGRRAQIAAAGTWAVTAQFASAGHMLTTWSIDPVLWTTATWLLVRWTRLRDDRLLLWAGAVTAVALQVKFLIPVLWLGVGIAALLTGPRDLLRRPTLWCGAVLCALTLTPTLLWQHANGWPQLQMPATVASENSTGWLTLPLAVACAGLVGAVAVCFGTWRLLRAPHLSPYRYLGWAAIGIALAFAAVDGRPYYVAGLFGLLYAVAAVEWEHRPIRRWIVGTAYAASAVIAIAALPILPMPVIPKHDVFARGSIGWPELTAAVADAHRSTPPGTEVITHDYWSASALHHYGPAVGITGVHSGSRGFWHLSRPSGGQVLYVGGTRDYLLQHFREVRPMTTVDTGLAVDTYYEGTTIWLASGPRAPWPDLWPEFQRMGIFDGSTGTGAELPGATTGVG
ncbi:Dolichyl-phosphate-mannose-protein mannosyltransferase [Saccharopolyspora antimicrobica]|uniref:Dolichyl-phosphate-mannose-protein mannosyltransferase n=1 Tax=Saccharopolyspora antimicrobica TaxID=455193 RepID=A0A1I4X2P4_9PSEU|nr:glycosyltransferase family 39 protein [Saccharopolyspora antimicrobica]RKT84273.1 dolichyl-phosphate-mannose-protein mannosyltransferase [Saccharopolyspora antimicrobica]SFN19922.1 Dolichyl-phosphate-mannose-protein mannosyltransferase [Saccharopolyspora antimicrobica]